MKTAQYGYFRKATCIRIAAQGHEITRPFKRHQCYVTTRQEIEVTGKRP